jgi:hypothetical protein
MVTLKLKDSGKVLGKISDEEFQFLVDQLEEESEEDTDYYIDGATVDMLEEAGAPATLLSLLRGAISGEDGVEVEWARS